MVVWPAVAPLAIPPRLMGATLAAEDVHVTWEVKSTVAPSLNLPVALNARVAPFEIVGVTGLIVRLVIVAGDTVRFVVPVIPANTALMEVVPAPTPVAMPCRPPALLMVAMDGEDDAQLTLELKLMVCWPAVPVAVNGTLTPTYVVEFAGVRVIAVMGVEVTATDAVP